MNSPPILVIGIIVAATTSNASTHAGPPYALTQPTTTLRFDVTRERGHKEDFTRQRVSVEASLNNRAKVVLGRLRGASGDDAVWSARLMR